ncbi:MAG: serine hydrolase [Chitinophagaceae bacterium]|jgi:CubicO group peptidase (beta-lactamase class C family)|nr:serine hydrolase [Chitinophagaceae bacterium]
MKRWMIIVLATVAIRAEAQQGSDKLNEYCKAAEATGRFHGYVLVKQKGRVLLSSGFGYSDYTSKSKGTAQTRYQVGSVTKQFTASVILKLAEAGKLSLRDALSKYFREFPNADKVTIEHLLTHTSGIYNYTNSRKAFDSLRGIASSRDEMMRMIAHYPYDFEPGTRWNYSNSAYSILGYIIEKVTGKPYERNVREMIFTPLGMTRSGFDYPSAAGPKATGYYLIQEPIPVKAASIDSTISFSAGAIYTTPEDLLTWDESITSGKILKATSLKNAWTPRMNKYGLGWFIDTIHNKPAIHHGGAIDGFMTQNIIVPDEGITVIVIVNAEMYNADEMARDLLGIVYGVPVKLPEQKTEINLPASALQSYTGNYEINPEMKATVKVEDGKLMIAPEGQPWAQLFPESENTFFFRIMDAKIEFVKDGDGKVVKFLFKQGGRVMEAVKKE